MEINKLLAVLPENYDWNQANCDKGCINILFPAGIWMRNCPIGFAYLALTNTQNN